jgi:hypothetical protein
MSEDYVIKENNAKNKNGQAKESTTTRWEVSGCRVEKTWFEAV